MNVLILSANTGQGHNSCSEAIKEVFDMHKDPCEICDALAFMSKGISNAVVKIHVGSYRKAPGAFGWGYRVSEKHPAVFGTRSPLYLFFKKGAKKLKEYIQSGGFDTVIACHVFAAVILTAAKKTMSGQIKTAFVATDHTRSPSLEQSSLDHYFIPDKSLADEFVTGNITREKLCASGIPVRRKFYMRVDKKEAKRRLGIEPENRHIIVMCGSMGCGPIEKLAAELSKRADACTQISIICGTNEKLERKLKAEYFGSGRIHIFGYVEDTSLFMDSADLYLTKPGGISTCEAAVKRLPMVFVNAVSGCESYNCSFFVNSGGAVTAKKVEDIAKICIELLGSENSLCEMSAALEETAAQNAAEVIYDVLKE